MKQLYEITRKLAGKYKRTDRPIKDKNGNVLTSDEDQLKRWREHFEELLNRPPPQNPPDITPAEEVLQINCERPSKAEIEKAIHHMKRGKASGPDKIPEDRGGCQAQRPPSWLPQRQIMHRPNSNTANHC